MNDVYASEDYKQVIDLFKRTAFKIAQEKINLLKKKFGLD